MNITKLHDSLHRIEGSQLPIIEKEIYRYMGYSHIVFDENVDRLVKRAIDESIPLLSPASICESFPVRTSEELTDLGFATTESHDIRRNLRNSEHLILIASTIGSRFDRLLLKYSKTDPVMAAILQATGAMFIESYLDMVNDDLAAQAKQLGYSLRPRFSPGYGDLPLSIQKDIFRVLRADRIGLTLCDSLLMSPSKSVTAIIGIERTTP